MKGIRTDMDYQRVYAARVETAGAIETVSVSVFVDHESDESLLHPHHPATLLPIVNALNDTFGTVVSIEIVSWVEAGTR